MESLKEIAFLAVLGYAAFVDIKRQTVPTHVHILLILTGLISVSAASFLGAAVTFLPFFIVAILSPNQLGGGDVKLAAGCGFVVGGIHGLIGLSVGLILAIILVPAWRRFKEIECSKPFPLVPFFFIGFLQYFLFLKGM